MNLIAALSARDSRDATADIRDATAIVAALYAEHALGLTRLAQVMLGDRAAAEDVVHDAFCGLCRRWDHLTDPRKVPAYLRSSVLNGCRSALRRQAHGGGRVRAPGMRRWTARRPARTRTGRCWQARAGGSCSRRCGSSRTGSGKCSCCATTWSFPMPRSRGP